MTAATQLLEYAYPRPATKGILILESSFTFDSIKDLFPSSIMAITELIFPRVKTDQGTLEELERDWPKLSKGLTNPNPGLLHASRGWVLTENGKHVRDAFKEFLLFGELNY